MMSQLFLRFWFVAIMLGAPLLSRGETSPRLYAVELSAQVAASPARITLTWPADANATSYTVDRKAPNATSWTRLTTLAGTASSYADVAVAAGALYEYQVIKAVPYRTSGVGYITAGVQVPAVENRGKLILLVDSTHAAALATELRRLETDLIGDGWTVIRRDVARTATPPQVKAIVKGIYDADPANVRSLFIFGHVAVPYSGDIYPDMHPDHKGAWPTDAYYAELNGTWTDSTVNTTSAEKLWNRNTPGDGKFDQNDIPTPTELEVGRVDLYNMTCFANKTPSRSELDLLRQYLNKDHNYRHANFKLQRRGLVSDNFGETGGEAFAATGWRNFAPFFGASKNIQVGYGEYFNTLASQDYLFSYATGGGSWYTCNGVGSSDNFALTDTKSVFSFVFGSYFGDWDNESSFLRAPLGSTSYTLVSAWAGRPHWFVHPMGMGETIGHSARLSQNNRVGGTYRPNHFAGGTHVSLMGDPTLRLHTVNPPRNVTITAGSGNTLSWQASTDTNLVGYYVYRADSVNGPFVRISGASAVNATSFYDPAGTASQTYMVRSVKLENEASGTYYNLSQGIFAGANVAANPTPAPTPTAPVAPSNLTGTTPTSTTAVLTWRDNSSDESSFVLFRRDPGQTAFVQRATLGANATSYTDAITSGALYTYKVLAANAAGQSAFSAEASIQSAAPAPAQGVPTAPANLAASPISSNKVSLRWWNTATNATAFTIYRKAGNAASFNYYGMVGKSATNIQDVVVPGVMYTYAIRATNTAGASAFSNEATVQTAATADGMPAAPAAGTSAQFLGFDAATSGTWKGNYGADGQVIVADSTSLPAYASLTPRNHQQWIWTYSTGDTRCPQRATVNDRMAPCWFAGTSFDVDLTITGDSARLVSLYLLDWDQGARAQKIDVIDRSTGSILTSTSVSNFSAGTYAQFRVKGDVTFRLTRTAGPNAVLTGVFFDQ